MAYTTEDMVAIMQAMERRHNEPRGLVKSFPSIKSLPADRHIDSLIESDCYDLPYRSLTWHLPDGFMAQLNRRFASPMPDLWVCLANGKRGQLVCGSVTPGKCVEILLSHPDTQMLTTVTGPLSRFLPNPSSEDQC